MAYGEVPQGLHLLPAGRVGEVAQAVAGRLFGPGRAHDRRPAVELAVGAAVARLELRGRHARGAKDRVSRIVQIPLVVQHAALGAQPTVQRRAGVRRQNMERGRVDALPHGPVGGPREDRGVVAVHAEDEARVDHDTQLVQAADGGFVEPPRAAVRAGAGEVLQLALGAQVVVAQRLEADEQAATAGRHGPLEQPRLQHGLHGGRRLPHTPHAAHGGKERGGVRRAAEEVVVEEVEVAAGQSLDLGERVVERLQVERAAAGKERLLVTEVAQVGAAA